MDNPSAQKGSVLAPVGFQSTWRDSEGCEYINDVVAEDDQLLFRVSGLQAFGPLLVRTHPSYQTSAGCRILDDLIESKLLDLGRPCAECQSLVVS